MWILLVLVLAVGLIFGQVTAPPEDKEPTATGKTHGWTNQYDRAFKAAVRTWYPQDQQGPNEWVWLKAQAISESGLKPDAVSPVGAKGLMQIMPETWEELEGKHPTMSHPLDAHASIVQGTQYMAWLADQHILAPSIECRRNWQLASYNAGIGRVRKLRVKAGGEQCWNAKVSKLAPKETRQYVRRVRNTYQSIMGVKP